MRKIRYVVAGYHNHRIFIMILGAFSFVLFFLNFLLFSAFIARNIFVWNNLKGTGYKIKLSDWGK